VHVFTKSAAGPGDSAVPLGQPVAMDGVKVWYFPSQQLRRLYWSPRMARALRREVGGFDLVHLHSVFLWPTWAAARAARQAHVPYVLSPRGMLVRDLIRRKSRMLKSAWIALIERRNIVRAAAIHVTSELEAQELAHLGFALPTVAVVANGVAMAGDRSGGPVSSDVRPLLAHPNLILCLGRINWKKGLDRLIPAMLAVRDAHLAIVGNDEEGLMPQLSALAAQHGLSGRVSFVPRTVQDADKSCLFEAAKVFALASYSENFGNTVIEAMAVGCPVLVTPEVGAAAIVRDSGGGRVASGEPVAFGAVLRALLEDPARAEIGARGRLYVETHCNWNSIAAEMEQMYSSALDGARKTVLAGP
jgi:glycosyltransferase involved in cell wall biosynthesis